VDSDAIATATTAVKSLSMEVLLVLELASKVAHLAAARPAKRLRSLWVNLPPGTPRAIGRVPPCGLQVL
jgi:hypothetical protein